MFSDLAHEKKIFDEAEPWAAESIGTALRVLFSFAGMRKSDSMSLVLVPPV